jgi:hypothetical protein
MQPTDPVKIFESPDSGQTVYVRDAGNLNRHLFSYTPEESQYMDEMDQESHWLTIWHARNDNPELALAVERVIIIHALTNNQAV